LVGSYATIELNFVLWTSHFS